MPLRWNLDTGDAHTDQDIDDDELDPAENNARPPHPTVGECTYAAYHFGRDAKPRAPPEFPYGDYYLAENQGKRKITRRYKYRTIRSNQPWEQQSADIWKALVRVAKTFFPRGASKDVAFF